MNYGYEAKSIASGSLIGGAGYGTDPQISPQQAQSALGSASDEMEHDISQALSLAELLAQRLQPLLSPVPAATGGMNGDKVARSYSPYVETVHRQRSRIQAVSAQLQDIINRLEV